MNCLFSAQGELICTEHFENCQNEDVASIGTNCGDACQFNVDGFKGRCYAHYPESKANTCKCDQKYKYVSYEPDANAYSEINGSNAKARFRLVGGARAQQFDNLTPNDCFFKNRELEGDGYTINNFTQDMDENNYSKPGTCVVFFNGK